MKFAPLSVQHSCHLWPSLRKVRSKFWFLDLFEFRSLTIASFGSQRTLPGRSRGTPGVRRGRSRSSPSAPWAPWGASGGSQDRFLIDFRCLGDRNGFKFDRIAQISIEMSIQIWFQIASRLIRILIHALSKYVEIQYEFQSICDQTHRNLNKMWLRKRARSCAFVSFRQLWSALVGLGPLRSAVVGLCKS